MATHHCRMLFATLLMCSLRVAMSQLSFVGLDENCSFTEFAARATSMESVCCVGRNASQVVACDKSLPATCTVTCAEQYVPFYHACVRTIDVLFNDKDTVRNGKAIAFLRFEEKCSSMPTAPLFAKVAQLRSKHCDLDLSKAALWAQNNHGISCKAKSSPRLVGLIWIMSSGSTSSSKQGPGWQGNSRYVLLSSVACLLLLDSCVIMPDKDTIIAPWYARQG